MEVLGARGFANEDDGVKDVGDELAELVVDGVGIVSEFNDAGSDDGLFALDLFEVVDNGSKASGIAAVGVVNEGGSGA